MVIFSHSDDIELLEHFQEGNVFAYEEIYHRYWQILFRFSRKMLKDDVLAEDVVQEVFAVLWQKRENGNIQPPLASYLYTLTRNRVLNIIKHSKIENRYLEYIKEMITSGDYIPDTLYIQKELSQQIEAEIQNLPEKMRIVFQMSRKEYKTNQEIADELGISQQTVKNQVSNAIRTLKDKLGDSINIFLFFF